VVRRSRCRPIKGKVKKKSFSRGWNFSTFAAHLFEQDLFWPSAPCARLLNVLPQRFFRLHFLPKYSSQTRCFRCLDCCGCCIVLRVLRVSRAGNETAHPIRRNRKRQNESFRRSAAPLASRLFGREIDVARDKQDRQQPQQEADLAMFSGGELRDGVGNHPKAQARGDAEG
jgi:hypothetical protein